MALLRTLGLSHTNLSLRCPLGCILAVTKPPQNLLYLSLLLFALTCEHHHHCQQTEDACAAAAMQNEGSWQKLQCCVQTHSLLFSSSCCLAPMQSWGTAPAKPRSRNSPSRQMAATAGSQETTFLLPHDVGVLTASPDMIPRGCQFPASRLRGCVSTDLPLRQITLHNGKASPCHNWLTL